jgi:hypothetical protein
MLICDYGSFNSFVTLNEAYCVNLNQWFNECCLSVFLNLNLEWCIDLCFLGALQLSEKFNLDGNIELQVFNWPDESNYIYMKNKYAIVVIH